MSADLPFTRDRANLIARAEQVATPCRVFRVEAHGSHHFCADCQKSEASHIIRALLDELALDVGEECRERREKLP